MDIGVYERILARVSGNGFVDRDIEAPEVEVLQEYNRECFSDFVLRVKGTHLEFHLHKVIVASQSEYFNAMFSGRWKESVSNTCELELEEPLTEVMEGFINFMYTGKVSMTLRDFWLYFILADRYLVNSLREACEDFVRQSLFTHIDKNSAHKEYVDGVYVTHICSVHDIAQIFRIDEVIEIYDAFASPRVKASCAKNLLARVDQIPVATFLALPVDIVSDMLQMHVCAIREEALFQMVVKWIESDPRRKRYVVRLFSSIRFGDIPEARIYEYLQHPLLVDCRPISDHICTCMFYATNRAVFKAHGDYPQFNCNRFTKRFCLGHATV